MTNWDKSKKAAFVAAMGRQKFAKGGAVRRKHFDVGGPTTLGAAGDTTAAGPLAPGGILSNIGGPNSTLSGVGNFVTSVNPLNTQDQFQATAAPIQAGTNAQQLNTAYGQAQQGISAQGQFMNQLGAQNGIGNQANVYNQYQGIANGTGPNPAQALLHQQTGQNVANQAALMAGQRGASSNVGLMARQAAQQGAATQQQAVGQGATQQANQSLSALGQMGQIAGNQINQQGQAITGYNTATQNEQNALQGANSNYNNSMVGMQSNLNNVNGQISQGNQAANNGMMQGVMNGGAGMSMLQGMLAKGGVVGRDGRRVSAMTITPVGYTHHYDDGGSVDFDDTSYTAPETASAPNPGTMAATDEAAPFKQSSGGGGGGGGGGLALLAMLADGGEVNLGSAGYSSPVGVGSPNIGSMASTDEAAPFAQGQKKDDKKTQQKPSSQGQGGGQKAPSSAPNAVTMPGDTALTGGTNEDMAPASTMMAAKGGHVCGHACGPHKSHVANYLARGGMPGKKVPAMVSPGEVYLSPDAVRKVIEQGANPMEVGTKVGGKAKVKNDSLKNDTIPATLEEGGVVIPRHISTHRMAAEKAELFVHRAMARNKVK